MALGCPFGRPGCASLGRAQVRGPVVPREPQQPSALPGGDGRFPQRVDAMWDTYVLFDRTAKWTDAPTGVLSWGYTIMRTRDQLVRDFEFATSPQ